MAMGRGSALDAHRSAYTVPHDDLDERKGESDETSEKESKSALVQNRCFMMQRI